MKWTSEDARRYSQVKDAGLSLLYEKAKVSANPEARENYLRDFLGINPDSETEAFITSYSGRNDPVSRLKILEEIAVSELVSGKTY